MGYEIVRAIPAIDEVIAAAKDGRLKEPLVQALLQ